MARVQTIYNLVTRATTCYPHSSLHPQCEFHTSFLSHFVFLRSVRRLLVTASVVPSSPILVTVMIEALSSSETSSLTRATRRNIQEGAILHSHRRENLNSYTSIFVHFKIPNSSPNIMSACFMPTMYTCRVNY
jgi:hypothetical protein